MYVEAMMEQSRQQNVEYKRSLEERVSVLVEQQKQLVELNEQQAEELKSLRQRHVPSTVTVGETSALAEYDTILKFFVCVQKSKIKW